MNSKNITITNFIYAMGCIVLFMMPLLGVYIIWNSSIFKLDNAKSKKSKEINYNFSVEPGEDKILTKTVKKAAKRKVYSTKTVKAELLKIDKYQIQGPIIYGTDGEEIMKRGFWQYPASVNPGEEGLSTIFGHRRYHLPPAKDTFFYLDRVKKGDRLEIKLKNGKWLEYKVVKTYEIYPKELPKELNEVSKKSILKLITCTPLGTSERRLIVKAKRVI